MLQFIRVNVAAYDSMDADEYVAQNCSVEKEYYNSLYTLFTQYVDELLVKRDPNCLNVVRRIWPVLYNDHITYTTTKSKKDTAYIKHMVVLCGLSHENRAILSYIAKTIWTGKFSTDQPIDEGLNFTLTKIVAYVTMHKFISKCKEEATFVEGKNVTVQRAITFLGNTSPKQHIAMCNDNIRQLNSIIRIFDAAIEVFESLLSEYEDDTITTDNDSF